MGIDYGIVCVDCGEMLHLGKSHGVATRFHSTEFALDESYGFSAIGNISDDFRDQQVEFLAALKHFLLLHRQHELRVLPDNAASVQDCWHWYDDLDNSEGGLLHLLSQELSAPWPDQEVKSLDPNLLKRLGQNARKAEARHSLSDKERQKFANPGKLSLD